MQRCCFCFKLRGGSLATAIFMLAVSVVQLIVLAVVYGIQRNELHRAYYQKSTGRYDYHEVQSVSSTVLDASFIPGIIICIVSGVFCVLLIFGIQKNNKCLFWPWMILVGLQIVAGIVSTAVFFILLEGPAGRAQLMTGGFSTAFVSYMFYCVVSYFRQMPVATEKKVIVVPYNKMESIDSSSVIVSTNPVEMQQQYPV